MSVQALFKSTSLVWLILWSGASLALSGLPDFTDIVREKSPAVVKILVEQAEPSPADGNPQIPEELRRFFEFRDGPPPGQERMGLGSGFIISEDGYIVTNNHVVEGADSVLVRMIDRSEYTAEIVGTDPRSDLALLRIDGSDLPMVELADDDALEVGEWVLAIGSPFGLDYSVSAGIISAKGRSLPTRENENYVPFIQSDVAINPGNSGGPLFNLKGKVVGVNSQIFTRSGGSIGLSFAVPAPVARNVVEQLKEKGRVTRGWLGVTIQDVDKSLADSFGLDRPEGALVVSVSPGSPAEDAGLESGDIIVTFDDSSIPTSASLPHIVGLITPGKEVAVEIVRDRKRLTREVKVGGLGADERQASGSGKSDAAGGGRLGMTVEAVDAQNLELNGISGGVIVRGVVPGSSAAEAGVRVGDLITLVDTQPIKSVEVFEKVVKKLRGGQSVPLRLIRQGSPLFIGLKVPD